MINRFLFKLFLGVVFLTCCFACKREVQEFGEVDTAYFPLETGRYVDYQVDSITFSKFDASTFASDVDTSSYYIREQIGTSDIDNEGNIYYRVNRFRREDTTSNWAFQDVWVAQIEGYRAMRVEENMRYINLTFPIEEEKEWNGLVFIRTDTSFTISNGENLDIFKDWDNYVMEDVDAPMIINGLSFDETLTVAHVDKENAIERRYSLEQYAKGVGLIQKDMMVLDAPQCTTALCVSYPWIEPQKGQKGFILRQRVIGYN